MMDSTAVLYFLCAFLCFAAYVITKKRKYNLPPGPSGLPFLGILPFLSENPHLDFIKWSKQYGGIFSVYMGRRYTVVVTDVVAAKQLLGNSATAARPAGMFPLVPDGIGFAAESDAVWSEQRKFTFMEMKNLGLGKSSWENLIQMEVSEFLELLEQHRGEPVDFEEPLSVSISNNVLSLVTNHRLPIGDCRRFAVNHGVKSFQELFKQTGFISQFPKLFQFVINLGLLRVGNKIKDLWNMNQYIRQEIKRLKGEGGDDSFIHKYLAQVDKNQRLNLKNSFDETSLLGNVQALIIAGSDTTRVSLQYLLLAMASFPMIQKKVHDELDSVLGKGGSVEWIDRQKLPYCFASILEGQRWRTIAPLSLLHMTSNDIVINGYDIPKGTEILTVLWAFHYDTRFWKDPEEFQPERFLLDDGKTVKESEAFLPFSFGKRICPGKTVALIELFHYFVCIMQKFQIRPVSESSLPDVEGTLGLSLQPKAQPLRFVLREF